SFPEIFQRVADAYGGTGILVAFHRTMPSDAETAGEMLKQFLRSGYSRIVVGQEVFTIEEALAQKKAAGKAIAVVVDRVKLPGGAEATSLQTRVTEAL